MAATLFWPKKKEITAESIAMAETASILIISTDYACAPDAHVVMQNCLNLNVLMILQFELLLLSAQSVE